MSGDHTKYHGTAEVVKEGGLYLTREEMAELVDAIDETLYLLSPTDKDMQAKQGIYRVFTAFYKFALKIRKDYGVAPKREWVGLTDDEISEIKQTSPIYVSAKAVNAIVPMVEAKLKEKNT